MKKFTFPPQLLAAFFFLIIGWGLAPAQGCEAYYPMKKGAEFEISHFNAKDKLESVTTSKILSETSTGDVFAVTVESASKDARGKEASTVTFDATCRDGEFHMDMRSSSFGQMPQMEGMENMEIKIEAEDMVFPKGLAVGTALPDAGMTMTKHERHDGHEHQNSGIQPQGDWQGKPDHSRRDIFLHRDRGRCREPDDGNECPDPYQVLV